MTDETIVAVYDTAAHADAAVRELEAAKVPSGAISQHSGPATSTTAGGAGPVREQGFWSSLFGGEPDHDASVYDRSLDTGSSVVTVKVPSQHTQRVVDILEKHSPIDMDERAASYGASASSATTTATTATTASTAPLAQGTAMRAGGEEVVPLSEEQLTVGKRLVNRGTTRIRRFVVETPVEEAVTLHSEQVSIERRPASGAAAGDADFTDRTIEVTETDEEAVVAKRARVKEEVVINKAATERVETVRDTVRREDVEIVRDGQAATTTDTTGTAKPVPPTARPRV